MMLRTDQESRSIRQMEVKAVLVHSELGIKAGLPRLSWRPTQKMKAGMIAKEMLNRTMFEASRRLDALAVTALDG